MKKRLSETAAIYGISQTIVNNRTGNLRRISSEALVYPDIYDRAISINEINRLAEITNVICILLTLFLY